MKRTNKQTKEKKQIIIIFQSYFLVPAPLPQGCIKKEIFLQKFIKHKLELYDDCLGYFCFLHLNHILPVYGIFHFWAVAPVGDKVRWNGKIFCSFVCSSPSPHLAPRASQLALGPSDSSRALPAGSEALPAGSTAHPA
jgi:hypothetical protein